MAIVFFCQSCGARFEIESRMAGKRGHCKKCGQIMTIPRGEDLASSQSLLALPAAAARVADGGGPANAAAGPSMASWLKGGLSDAVLAPITVDRLPVGYKRPTKPSPLDDSPDSKPYLLAQPARDLRGQASRPINPLLGLWRQGLGKIQKVFRTVHQVAYLISVPFVMVLVFGVVVGNRHLALMGATAVVLLNIGRLVAGAANLAVVPLRDGANVGKLRKPLRRVIEPAVTIGLVLLAFTFIPVLSRGKSAKGSISDRLRAGAQDLGNEMKGEVNRAVDVDKLGDKARETFKQIGDKAREIDVSKIGTQVRQKFDGTGSSTDGASKTPKDGEGSP